MQTLKPYLSSNFILACSGGVDSMVLASELVRILPHASDQLTLIYLNHNQRSKIEIIKDWKTISLFSKKNKVRSMKINLKIKKNESESEMRKIRYETLIEKCAEFKAVLLTAHHQDDQIETLIFRLLRGTHPESIRGIRELNFMKSKNRIKILVVRPMLNVSKEEILKTAKKRKLKWSEDKTNLTSKYTRNRIRNELLPLIEQIRPSAALKMLEFFQTLIRQNDKRAQLNKTNRSKLRQGLEVKKTSFDELKRLIDSTLDHDAQRTTRAHWENLKRQIELRHATKEGGGPRKRLQFPGGFEVSFIGKRLFWKQTR